MTWSKPITTGVEPSPRAGHSCIAVGTKLYYFGGGDGTTYLNDLHILDTGYYSSFSCSILFNLTLFSFRNNGMVSSFCCRY